MRSYVLHYLVSKVLRCQCLSRNSRLNPLLALIMVICTFLALICYYGFSEVRGQVDSFSRGTGFDSIPRFGTNSTHDLYAVIFDAGSTGSRIHVYHFEKHYGADVKLIHETFEQVKPGLSNYSSNPQKGAKSLQVMLNNAVEEVPSSLHPTTPIVLKATAGLRLLPEGAADNLLNEVSSLFMETKFRLVEGSVQILDGVDEGIYSWVTVNYLEDAFSKHGHTVAALDLGGGSTQITFVPENKETLEMSPKDFLKETNLFGKTYTLYTHSYLGQGLMSARFQIMGGKEDKISGAQSEQDHLYSSCLPPGLRTNWVHHGGINFKLRGLKKDESGYKECYKTVKQFTEKNVRAVAELNSQKIYAFSYFFDRAIDADLIEETGGKILVKDYQTAAEKACGNPVVEEPFLCLDLTYIYSLLSDGYKLNSNTNLQITKKIKKVEVSWALGAAFQVLSELGQLS